MIINRPPNWDNISYKVKAMIQHVLFPEHVKYIKEHNMWYFRISILNLMKKGQKSSK